MDVRIAREAPAGELLARAQTEGAAQSCYTREATYSCVPARHVVFRLMITDMGPKYDLLG